MPPSGSLHHPPGPGAPAQAEVIHTSISSRLVHPCCQWAITIGLVTKAVVCQQL